MSSSGLPEEVRAFIRQNISSIEQLEILLHLYEIAPQQKTAEQIAQSLYLSPESTARQLVYFREKGLVTESSGPKPSYSLESKESNTGRSIGALALTYRERRVSVINEIFSNPISTIQTFADAFIINKKKNNDG
jgi:hypothetical protein